MKKLICLFTLWIFIRGVYAQSLPHVPGELIVLLKKDADVTQLLSASNPESNELRVLHCLNRRMNIWLIGFSEWNEEKKILSEIRANKNVHAAQFNHITELRVEPNDVNFGQQWNLLNVAQTGGTMDADIDANDAWNITSGGVTAAGDTVVIAVVDDGIDLLQEDLLFWKNENEIPLNSMDDDGNGYVDDYDGWNAVSHNGVIPVTSHGTHVSGIAAARGNNSIGISGINWNAKILPVKGSSSSEATVVEAYGYVYDLRKQWNESGGTEGAFVVVTNSSFGVNLGQPENFPIWCAMYDSLGSLGILNAGATTNSNVDVDVQGDMPTACSSDWLITVTNSNNIDVRNNSGYGDTTIDLAAPGTAIISTDVGNSYTLKTGTSMASPHVAGAVALLYSIPCEAFLTDYAADPAATALLFKNFILDNVDEVTDLSFTTLSGGRLNVYNAMIAAMNHYGCDVGIDEAEFQHTFLFYPNPTTGKLRVTNMETDDEIIIHDLTGRIIFRQQFRQGGDISIDLSALPSGLYMGLFVRRGEYIGRQNLLIAR
jgi:hypothetical protein